MSVTVASGMFGKRGYNRIMVVDGARHIARLVQVNLERAGFEVVCAYSAQETTDYIARELPDLLMMNAVLPDADGYAFTRQLKDAPRTAALPIFLFIPNGSHVEVEKARSAGADDYFPTPYE